MLNIVATARRLSNISRPLNIVPSGVPAPGDGQPADDGVLLPAGYPGPDGAAGPVSRPPGPGRLVPQQRRQLPRQLREREGTEP